jgi:hypothetical protein
MLELEVFAGRGRAQPYGKDWKQITGNFKDWVDKAEKERDAAIAAWSQAVSDKQRERLVGVLRAAKTSAFYSSVHTSTRRLLRVRSSARRRGRGRRTSVSIRSPLCYGIRR